VSQTPWKDNLPRESSGLIRRARIHPLSSMQSEPPHHMQWLWIGLAIMFVLIGASVFVSVVFLNGSSTLSNPGAVWGFVGPAIGFFFLIFFIFGWAWFPYGRRYGRRRYRGYYGGDDDDAVQVLRQRYARGEITKEQLEQMTKDLEQHSTRY
jgi:uncharacterized membrane protein